MWYLETITLSRLGKKSSQHLIPCFGFDSINASLKFDSQETMPDEYSNERCLLRVGSKKKRTTR